MEYLARIFWKVVGETHHWDTIHKVELLWGIWLCGLIITQQRKFHSFSQKFTLVEHKPVLHMHSKALCLCYESHNPTCRNLLCEVSGRNGTRKYPSHTSRAFLWESPSRQIFLNPQLLPFSREVNGDKFVPMIHFFPRHCFNTNPKYPALN